MRAAPTSSSGTHCSHCQGSLRCCRAAWCRQTPNRELQTCLKIFKHELLRKIGAVGFWGLGAEAGSFRCYFPNSLCQSFFVWFPIMSICMPPPEQYPGVGWEDHIGSLMIWDYEVSEECHRMTGKSWLSLPSCSFNVIETILRISSCFRKRGRLLFSDLFYR